MKRERFIEELETYTKQVDEFAMLSDMNDVAKYLKKAQSLNTKLETAAERVLAFNAEEEAFGWPITQYPLRVSALATLKPYLQLYELTVDFNSKQKCARLLLPVLSGRMYRYRYRCWCTALHCTAICVRREWMEGPMANVVPDAVDQEVGNFWRSLYKLERGFENVATARKIAQKARCALFCTVQ